MNSAVNRKVVDRALTNLKSCLESGDVSQAQEILSAHSTPYFLTRFRERKLVNRISERSKEQLLHSLQTAAACLEPKERLAFQNYLSFSVILDVAKQNSLGILLDILRSMPKCSKADLLAMGDIVLQWFADAQSKEMNLDAGNISVAERERRLHELNGF